ncbi:hypothetical protein GJU39_10575 [Pedobacter petrophilus]|uniref:Lipoprotein n=1 Tax=Pedobacter petrophilus TaxID=1908241 RepID=A0A7K0G0M1_9SPHI|nr:hypothetical protein [Pedobacter petrophilus]MRX76536.1 hypothetical protein [Pedobacter petrophilus]
MNKLTYLVLIIFFVSCQQNSNKSGVKQSESVKASVMDSVVKSTKNILFKKANTRGVLLGENIKLLDEHLNEIKDISFLKEQIVQVLGLSEDYFKAKPTDEYCQEFKYVKIKFKDVEGYVDGRKVYELTHDEQTKVFDIDDNELSFTPTKFYGIGVADDNGLTGCQPQSPVVFAEKNAQYKGLVKMVKNKYVYDDYPYFELKADDGNYDEIVSVKKQDDKYVLEIKRDFQEGIATRLVAIYKNSNGVFVAEIITSSARRTSN